MWHSVQQCYVHITRVLLESRCLCNKLPVHVLTRGALALHAVLAATDGTTPPPAGSTAFAECSAACSADICVANKVPACSCFTTAYSSSLATAGTCQICPLNLQMIDPTICDSFTCQQGNYELNGEPCAARCWYPDSNVKSGKGGYLYPCPGTQITSYTLTGGTSISMCAGCVSLGAAYDKNATQCYGGNFPVPPVDP